MNSEYIQVVTTVATAAEAERIASGLLEARLAACVQIVGPLTSMYWWQGKIDRAGEYQCLIKSRADRFQQVAEAISGLHPYEVPEIIALPLTAISQGYQQWLAAELPA